MTNSPAGWYPQEDGRQRYWDGAQWTEHFAPGTAAAPPAVEQSTLATSAKRWFKKKRLMIPAGVVGVIILGSALGSAGGDEPTTPAAGSTTTSSPAETSSAPSASPAAAATTSASPAATAAPKPAATKPAGPRVGSKVRDGKFEFVVSKVTCGIKSVGNEYLNTKAQGQFCRLDVSISNIGDEPQTMFADNQIAYDSKGRKFSADSEASIYDDKSEVLLEEINPGNTIKGRVYFDVPKNVKLAKVELHDSAFSDGVDVALTK